jgi:hypothetical protein
MKIEEALQAARQDPTVAGIARQEWRMSGWIDLNFSSMKATIDTGQPGVHKSHWDWQNDLLADDWQLVWVQAGAAVAPADEGE